MVLAFSVDFLHHQWLLLVIFDPTQSYDSYKAVEVLDPACTECLEKGKDCFENYNPRSSKCHYLFIGKTPCCCTGKQTFNIRRYLWSKKNGPFGKEFPVSEAPTLDGTSGYSALTGSKQRYVARWTNAGGLILVGGRQIHSSSEVPISRINTEGIVKRIRQIANSPPDPDAEGSDELDVEEADVVPNSAGHPSNTSPSQPPAKRFQSQVIPTVRPSPIQQSRNSPIVTSQQLKPVASTIRRREELSPFPFPAAQLFQRMDQRPIRVTKEDPNTESDNQDVVARLFRRVYRNSREAIMYCNDRTIPGTASEEMAEKCLWYEDELINYLQKTFDYLGRDK
ncbi:hypothetical protein O181_091506 [Austropuccinia psidii MF-1]|uniref:Uncharacterized protein n=1 Tax=Austropuccinia psidii MF-1 TaxID=1389203 RepID=A0A9Q3IXN7_9BASI|nr:hypothetical protein [Austropuccinia psidii MF-1]